MSDEMIDSRDGVTLICAACGSQYRHPRNWREILLAYNEEWDGILRCRNGHDPEPVHGFEGMDYEAGPPRQWRGRCACGSPPSWSPDKDRAWHEIADHLLPALWAATESSS